jgi:hypothetical protein
MWSVQPPGATPVDNPWFSPPRPHRQSPLRKPSRGAVPVIHTLYDYDKGIS